MINPFLIAASKTAVAAKPRKFVTPAILLAVVEQESRGVPYFTDLKPGSQFKCNVQTACVYWVKHKDGTKTRHETGFKEADIRRMITIETQIGAWSTPRAMVGQLAKFRLEPSYWEQYPDMPPVDRFMLCSSWGLVQFMGPNISKEHDINFIRRFRADIPMQLLYGAGMIDQLLEETDGDVNLMYRGYNSGDIHSEHPDVLARAKSVEVAAHTIQQLLR